MKTEVIEAVKEDLIRHEGYVAEIYLDSENLPTFGIGHLVTEQDMEYTWPVGTPVEDERILCAIFMNLDSQPTDCQRVCINMAFNLGRSRLSKFKNMIRYVNEGNYLMAANEMVNSKWYSQVGRRSKELVDIMKEVRADG